jgi:hypothetical protein
MSKRINVMIDEDTWELLQKVPSGERSQTINNALRLWAKRRRRQDAIVEMKTRHGELANVSTAEIVKWAREDREQNHSC